MKKESNIFIKLIVIRERTTQRLQSLNINVDTEKIPADYLDTVDGQ